MKRKIWLILGILGLPLVAVGAYFWANAQMDSVYAYRSPLRFSPPAPGHELGASTYGIPVTERLVIVLIDALRLDTSLDANVMPVLNGLRAQGASATMHSRPPSFSEPGYTTLLTGAWPDINDGPAVNLDYAEIPTFTQDDIFSAAHRSGLHTAISGYYWFEKLVPQGSVDVSFYTPGEDAAADRDVVSAALPWLRQDYQLVLIHIDQVDYAGHHEGGPRDPHWNAAATRADTLLGVIVDSLDLQLDTVLVVSDHGQIDRGGHGGPEPVVLTEPFVIAGSGVRPGSYPDIQMVDVAPTLAALLGTNIPASSQGHPLTGLLTLDRLRMKALQAALVDQQTSLVQAYLAAIGSPTAPGTNADMGAGTQLAMKQARARRLSGERAPRIALTIILALALGFFLVRQRGKRWLWILTGSLVFILLFNLRYAILDSRPYSLSAVDSQDWLITYVGTTATLTLTAGWLVALFGGGTFNLRLKAGTDSGARQAAAITLRFIWLTLYLLALPVLLNLAVNGRLVTWTLPEFHTAYLALLSMIQAIIVAGLGLLLTGVAAAAGWLVARKA